MVRIGSFLHGGGVHGFFILVERWGKLHGVGLSRFSPGVKSMLRNAYVLLVVNFAWVLFRAPDISSAIGYFGTMFGIGIAIQPGFGVFWYLDGWTLLMMAVGLLLCSTLPRRLFAWVEGHVHSNALLVMQNVGILCLFVISAALVVSGTYNPFIYFQF